MATRTQSRPSNSSSSTTSRQSGSSPGSRADRSAFSWGDGAGPVIAAALGGMLPSGSPPITAARR